MSLQNKFPSEKNLKKYIDEVTAPLFERVDELEHHVTELKATVTELEARLAERSATPPAA
jgi:hypothetical protein